MFLRRAEIFKNLLPSPTASSSRRNTLAQEDNQPESWDEEKQPVSPEKEGESGKKPFFPRNFLPASSKMPTDCHGLTTSCAIL